MSKTRILSEFFDHWDHIIKALLHNGKAEGLRIFRDKRSRCVKIEDLPQCSPMRLIEGSAAPDSPLEGGIILLKAMALQCSRHSKP